MNDVFDIFFKKFAYKFPKGYPDLNNDQDILLLESILEKLGININEVEFKNLTFFDLSKRGGYRFADLAKKIENKLPFELVNGESTILQFIDPQHSDIFLSREKDDIKKLAIGKNINLFPFFKDNTGKTYSISDLLKDSYFGGQGKGSGTKVEDANLQLLNNQILDLVKENEGPINVKVGNNIYNNIVKAETQYGQPKSDFNLIDKDNKPVVFISHKKAGGKYADASDFIRWSGYTSYFNEPEVRQFNEALKNWLKENNLEQEGLPKGTRFISPIKDAELVRKLIYGPKYGDNEYSKDNVTVILQGIISLKPIQDNIYELIAEYELIPPQLPEGEYYPYLTSSYRADRNMFGIKNNEAIAMTKAVAFKAANIYELQGNQFEKVK
jgi:hypothetical protein